MTIDDKTEKLYRKLCIGLLQVPSHEYFTKDSDYIRARCPEHQNIYDKDKTRKYDKRTE
jgi:hypothetical protein